MVFDWEMELLQMLHLVLVEPEQLNLQVVVLVDLQFHNIILKVLMLERDAQVDMIMLSELEQIQEQMLNSV